MAIDENRRAHQVNWDEIEGVWNELDAIWNEFLFFLNIFGGG